jgi:hypothetical protein
MSEFVPDFVFCGEDELGRHVDVFLNGEHVALCLEARVMFESFERPVFGELIVASGGNVITRKPRLGEFDRDGAWAKFVCGKVFIKLDDEGKRILALLREHELCQS